MKKFIFAYMRILYLIMLLAFPFSFGNAADFPFLRNGKTWTVRYTNYHHQGDGYVFRYFIDGDTVVNGQSCMKLYVENEDNNGSVSLKGCLYEDGTSVYFMKAIQGAWYVYLSPPVVLYDFALSAGDVFGDASPISVVSTDEISVNGNSLKRIGLRYDSDDPGVASCYWVEGVGSSADLLSPKEWGRHTGFRFESCSIGTDTLFVYDDFSFEKPVQDDHRLAYRKMLAEGKKWVYQYHHFEEGEDGTEESVSDVEYEIAGDTVINGSQYFKMYQYSADSGSSYHSAWREDNRKVYMILSGSVEETLQYDFSLLQGAEFWCDNGEFSYLRSVETLMCNDEEYNQFVFFDLYDNKFFCWIEGISGSNGILYPCPRPQPTCLCDYMEFTKCMADGVQLYPSVQDTEGVFLFDSLRRSSGSAVYDLQGRKVDTSSADGRSQLPRGIYIQNGRKFVVK